MADEKAPQPEQTAGTAAPAPTQEAPKQETPKQEAPKQEAASSGDSGRGIGLHR
jgi:hypothetical protein